MRNTDAVDNTKYRLYLYIANHQSQQLPVTDPENDTTPENKNNINNGLLRRQPLKIMDSLEEDLNRKFKHQLLKLYRQHRRVYINLN